MTEPYNLDPAFERAVLALCCLNPRFWSRVGFSIDPKALAHPLARLVLACCSDIQSETGRGPKTSLIVIQRLARKKDEGKVTPEQIKGVVELLDSAEDFGLPDEEDAINELVPVIRRRMQSAAVLAAHDEFAKRGDFAKTVGIIERAERLGKFERISGSRLGASSFDEIERVKNLNRLPTGVLELDIKLHDGLARGQLGMWMADSGGGKSIALAHQAAVAVRRQLFVGFATLELPETVQLARLIANLTGVETNDIIELDHKRAEAKRRMEVMLPKLGACSMAEFSPHATTVRDLLAWVEQEEEDMGRPMDLLCVDYGDKLYEPRVKDGNTYIEMRYVFEALRRDIAVAKNMWVWTASQAGRPGKTSKRIELSGISDSMHKVRVADLVISINPEDDSPMLHFFVAKNRTGESRYSIGPLLQDFERGRLVVASSEFADWAKM